MRTPVKSSSSFTGKAACTRNCGCRDDVAGRIAPTRRRTSIEAVRVLARICSDDLLASTLNRNGLLTGRGNRWTRERVTALRTHHEIPCYDRDRRDVRGMDESDRSRSACSASVPERSGSPSSEARSKRSIRCADGPWVFHRHVLETRSRRDIGRSGPAPHARGRNTKRSPANSRFFRPFKHIARWGSMKRRCSTAGTRGASARDQPLSRTACDPDIRAVRSRSAVRRQGWERGTYGTVLISRTSRIRKFACH